MCAQRESGMTIEVGGKTSVSSEISVYFAAFLRVFIHLHTRDADGMALFAPSGNTDQGV